MNPASFSVNGQSYVIIYYYDRVILSGDLHQVFKCKQDSLLGFASYFSELSTEEKYSIAEVYREGTINKERACENASLLPLEYFEIKMLRKKIESCDCSPSVMRKKIKHFFSLRDEDINLLQLEDMSEEMAKTIEVMTEIAKKYIYMGDSR